MQQTSQILINTFSILNKFKVDCLLIGGQACVIYGAKTSTVDVDITILASAKNLKNLLSALNELKAEASPALVPVEAELLARGHSLRYYCKGAGFGGIRLDILGKLPRLDSFSKLRQRQFEYISSSGIKVPVLSLPDLILSKKTGRMKDAADISALVNSHYILNNLAPTEKDIELWLLEARETDVLTMFVRNYSTQARRLIKTRPLLRHALAGDISALKVALIEESGLEALKHEEFRAPLREEVKKMARTRRKRKK